MRFTGRGPIVANEKILWTVTWDDGVLSGDEVAVSFLRHLAKLHDGEGVGPVMGPYTYTERDHLASPISAVTLMREMFNEQGKFSGDIPHREPLPPGWIA